MVSAQPRWVRRPTCCRARPQTESPLAVDPLVVGRDCSAHGPRQYRRCSEDTSVLQGGLQALPRLVIRSARAGEALSVTAVMPSLPRLLIRLHPERGRMVSPSTPTRSQHLSCPLDPTATPSASLPILRGGDFDPKSLMCVPQLCPQPPLPTRQLPPHSLLYRHRPRYQRKLGNDFCGTDPCARIPRPPEPAPGEVWRSRF